MIARLCAWLNHESANPGVFCRSGQYFQIILKRFALACATLNASNPCEIRR